MSPPVYIALEGAEGCGKSTQAKRLADSIGAVVTRETGGTAIGERLRTILHDTTVTDLDDQAETLIVAADRAQHMAEVVRPALDAGRSVVSDRSVYSTLAYQGYGRGLAIDEVRRDQRVGDRGDLARPRVVLLECPPRSPPSGCGASARSLRAGRRRLPRSVSAGFAAMAAAEPERWVVVDAAGRRTMLRRRSAPPSGNGSACDLTAASCGTPSSANRSRSNASLAPRPQPVHAYLFVGPSGSTKKQAARAFAALLLGGPTTPGRDADLALARRAPRRERGRAVWAVRSRPSRRARSPASRRWPRRERSQGDDPRRVPSPPSRRRGDAAEDDRGTAAVDDVRRSSPTSCHTT